MSLKRGGTCWRPVLAQRCQPRRHQGRGGDPGGGRLDEGSAVEVHALRRDLRGRDVGRSTNDHAFVSGRVGPRCGRLGAPEGAPCVAHTALSGKPHAQNPGQGGRFRESVVAEGVGDRVIRCRGPGSAFHETVVQRCVRFGETGRGPRGQRLLRLRRLQPQAPRAGCPSLDDRAGLHPQLITCGGSRSHQCGRGQQRRDAHEGTRAASWSRPPTRLLEERNQEGAAQQGSVDTPRGAPKRACQA